MLPWLGYCTLIFCCSTPWGVVYVLYIINEFLLPFYKKNYTANHRSFQIFFCGICPLYYQYIYCTFFYKNYTAVYLVCQHLFTVHLSFTHTVHLSFLKPYFCPLLYINYLLKVIYYNKVFFFFENSNPFIIFNKKNQCSITH